MKIIAFTGPGGAGKNTAAQQLGTQYHTAEVSFAAPLYEMAAVALGMWVEDIHALKEYFESHARNREKIEHV